MSINVRNSVVVNTTDNNVLYQFVILWDSINIENLVVIIASHLKYFC